MTKKEAVRIFRSEVLPSVARRFNGKIDSVALAEAWNNWTDALCKDDQISMRQYERWTNPF